ncbi:MULTISPECIES: flagellar hook-basal body complex protein FliE [unclassified Caballeronia]|jgi:flagellar hook-basal body complex protein FliE|uniref:flagellar hook-basal body complex protein FliE n=1 Tax=unclassified Caballeronia TaxID=2646786 RepID=UPI003ECF95BC
MNAPISPLSSALQQMQVMATQAAGGAGQVASGSVAPESGAASAGSFADALKSSLDSISSSQNNAINQAQAFEVGAPNVSLNDVMIDMQKANVGFQFGLQVRNKLVSAYSDIMNIAV